MSPTRQMEALPYGVMLTSMLLSLIINRAVSVDQTAITSLTPAPTGDKVIKLGVILPAKGRYPWAAPKALPGILYAVETITNSSGLLEGYEVMVNYGDSQCSDTYGPLVAIRMITEKRANVFLGPACDYSVAPIARFSPHWNTPVITGGAFVQAFWDKSQYKQLTRISGSYAKLGEFFANMFAHKTYNWTTAAFIYHSNLVQQHLGRTDCYFIMEAIYTALQRVYKVKFPTKDLWNKAFDEKYPNRNNMTHDLKEASLNARVIVLCASPDSVRNIMIKAAELGFDNGEYVFFNIDLFSSKNQSEQPWHRDNDTQDRNRLARQAYEALMTVTLRKPDSLEYKKFSEEVKRRAQQQYGNFTYGKEEVNSFVGAFHDAVILYAIALNETLAAGYNATDGAEITKRMWNRSFEGITGTVSIDENGDRNADYSLLDFNPRSNKFEVVANYYGNRKKYEPVKDKIIFWPGGRHHPPPDTPKCGFDGSGCPSKDPAEEEEGVDDLLEQPGDTENPPNEYTEIC